MAELEYHGIMVDALDDSCTVVVKTLSPPPHPSEGAVSQAATVSATSHSPQPVNYAEDVTPEISSVSPKWGSSLGGTTITLTGSKLDDAEAVEVNGYECINVTVVSSTMLTCVTTRRTRLGPLSLAVTLITGSVSVAADDVTFRYLDRWSLVNTWQDDEPPVDGDSVVIPPDQVVLMDISPPKLKLLLVQGQLVFDRKDLELHAEYIWVQGGLLEVGTEQEPFMNKATITLYGDRWNSIGLPRLGSKCIVASNGRDYTALAGGEGILVPRFRLGTIDIHGIPRRRTWTKVATTVQAGSTTIVLSEPVDFATGDIIMLTAHRNYEQTEILEVASRSMDNLTLTLVDTVKYTHESAVHVIDGERVDMRVEVGVLNRNVVIQGEPGKSEAQSFGSHLMAAGGARLRLENAELRRCGQAGVLGRYCSHFHMSGDLAHSYIKSNSIHDRWDVVRSGFATFPHLLVAVFSFQRAITVHGTHRALVQNNVACRFSQDVQFLYVLIILSRQHQGTQYLR